MEFDDTPGASFIMLAMFVLFNLVMVFAIA